MMQRLRFLVTIHGCVLFVKFFIIIGKKSFFVNKQYFILFWSE